MSLKKTLMMKNKLGVKNKPVDRAKFTKHDDALVFRANEDILRGCRQKFKDSSQNRPSKNEFLRLRRDREDVPAKERLVTTTPSCSGAPSDNPAVELPLLALYLRNSGKGAK
ncbi:uncharacterized protein [Anoplolepis gracilipes]|uniref:uncharacterized protein isoform X1 n=1 Tax=Anoplolepis gracilipes TaxID=354296 RepID=UPI003B9E19DC